MVALGFDASPGHGFSLLFVLWQIAWSITTWSSVVFMLSLGQRILNFSSKTLTYGNEAVLPFYLLHQTIILCVGSFVIRWEVGALSKFLIIVVASLSLTMLLYELLVRRFNIVRFFFGMRPKKPSASPTLRPEGTAA